MLQLVVLLRLRLMLEGAGHCIRLVLRVMLLLVVLGLLVVLWLLLLLLLLLERLSLHVVSLQSGCILGTIHAARDLLVNLLGEQLLTERAEKVWLHKNIEPDLAEKLALHPVQFRIAQHREELGQRAVTHGLVLPHLVCEEK